jgi:steroid 5-alpha reductase family enzyme
MNSLYAAIGLDISNYWHIYAVCCVVMFAIVTALWIIGLRQGNHSMMDAFYGFLYALVGWIAFLFTQANSLYAGLLLLMISLHGCRLGFYLMKRWFGYRATSGGDDRYLGFVQQLAPGYWWKSFFIVMQPQTIVILVIGLPAYFGIMTTSQGSEGLNLFAAIGILVFGIGTYYEWLADGQLQAFKQDPNNKGRYLEFGVWKLTRHPNYFGNVCVWWGIYLTAVAGNPEIWWTVAGPILNTIMLTKVLGTTFQDKYMGTRPEYADLMKRTSPFFPRLSLRR